MAARYSAVGLLLMALRFASVVADNIDDLYVNLEVTRSSSNDYADLLVTWDDECKVNRQLNLTSNGITEPQNITILNYSQFTKSGLEYWTNYTVTVSCSTDHGFKQKGSKSIWTGPGNPHMVRNVGITTTQSAARFVIEEPEKMPHLIDGYNVTICSDTPKGHDHTRDHTSGAASGRNCLSEFVKPTTNQRLQEDEPQKRHVEALFRDLAPATNYFVNASGVIFEKNKSYVAEPFQLSFATEAIGELDVKLELVGTTDDYVGLQATWSDECQHNVQVNLTTNGITEPQIPTNPSSTKFIKSGLEYWTNYTVTVSCSTFNGFIREGSDSVWTGPGKPHVVPNVNITTTARTARFVIEEPEKMPHLIDGYNVTICSDTPKGHDHTRDGSGAASGRNCLSKFVKPTTNQQVQEDNPQKRHVEAWFRNLEPATDYFVNIFGIIFEENKSYVAKPYLNKFVTAHIVSPTNFQYALLQPDQVLIGWTPPRLEPIGIEHVVTIVYKVSYCLKETCKHRNTTLTQLKLTELDRNSTYTVAIATWEIHRYPIEQETLNGNFTTLAEDWPSPSNLTFSLARNLTRRANYNVSWSIQDASVKPVFEAKFCENSTSCFDKRTRELSLQIPLSYFRSYNLTLAATYALNLNQTVSRSASINYPTPGTQPDEVTSVEAVSVSSNSVQLRWKTSANIPEGLQRSYIVTDQAGLLNQSTSTENIHLDSLISYHDYHVYIQACVTYRGIVYVSKKTSFEFRTDVDAPGRVRDLEAVQVVETNVFRLSWNPPAKYERHGPIDFYIATVWDEKAQKIHELKSDTATNVTVTVPGVDKANYTFKVSAVNVNLEKVNLIGNETERQVQFEGVEAPVALHLLNRTSNSVAIEIEIAQNNSVYKLRSKFYKVFVKSTGNIVRSFARQLNVTGLHAYMNETLYAQACYFEDFCSANRSGVFLTNVGAASAVQRLRGIVSNMTNVLLTWHRPAIPNGPLDGYRIELVDLTNEAVKQSVILPPNDTSSFEYKSQDEYETYQLTVRAFSKDLDNKTHVVLGDAHHTTVQSSGTHVPKPTDVQQVKLEATSAELSWRKPESDKFNVIWYRVQVPQTNLNTFIAETSTNLTNLTPFSETRGVIYGCTAKTADKCGLARHFVVKTDAGEPSAPVALTAVNVSKTSADLQWQAPATPNGPISAYALDVFEGDNDTATYETRLDGNVHTHALRDLVDDVKYTVKLRAINIDSKNRTLLSKDATLQFVAGVSSSSFTGWLIALLTIVLLSTVVIVVVVIVRRRRQQVDETEHLVGT